MVVVGITWNLKSMQFKKLEFRPNASISYANDMLRVIFFNAYYIHDTC